MEGDLLESLRERRRDVDWPTSLLASPKVNLIVQNLLLGTFLTIHLYWIRLSYLSLDKCHLQRRWQRPSDRYESSNWKEKKTTFSLKRMREVRMVCTSPIRIHKVKGHRLHPRTFRSQNSCIFSSFFSQIWHPSFLPTATPRTVSDEPSLRTL